MKELTPKLLEEAISDIPHICNFCGLKGCVDDWCIEQNLSIGEFCCCNKWKWRGLCESSISSLKISFDEGVTKYHFQDLTESTIDAVLYEFAVLENLRKYRTKNNNDEINGKREFNPFYDSRLLFYIDSMEPITIVEFSEDIRKDVKNILNAQKKKLQFIYY